MFYNELCGTGREELSAELLMAFSLQECNSLTGGRAVMVNFIQLSPKQINGHLKTLSAFLHFVKYESLQKYYTICYNRMHTMQNTAIYSIRMLIIACVLYKTN